MGEYLTFKEKVEAMTSASPMNIKEVGDRVEGVVLEEDNRKNRLVMRLDIRKELADAIDRSGISQRKVGKALGIYPQNFCNFLNGRIPLPLKTIEEILFLLHGKMTKE